VNPLVLGEVDPFDSATSFSLVDDHKRAVPVFAGTIAEVFDEWFVQSLGRSYWNVTNGAHALKQLLDSYEPFDVIGYVNEDLAAQIDTIVADAVAELTTSLRDEVEALGYEVSGRMKRSDEIRVFVDALIKSMIGDADPQRTEVGRRLLSADQAFALLLPFYSLGEP